MSTRHCPQSRGVCVCVYTHTHTHTHTHTQRNIHNTFIRRYKAGLANLGTRKIFLTRAIHYSPNYFFLFLLPDQCLHIVNNMCIYTHIADCIEIVYELPLLPNNTVSETFLHKLGAVRSVDWMFIIWAPTFAVTGRIRDIGQQVLQSSSLTGSSNTASYSHIFFLIAFLELAFIRNII